MPYFSVLQCAVLTRVLAEFGRWHRTIASRAVPTLYAVLVAMRSTSPLWDSLAVLAIAAVAGTMLAAVVRTRQTLFSLFSP